MPKAETKLGAREDINMGDVVINKLCDKIFSKFADTIKETNREVAIDNVKGGYLLEWVQRWR